MDQNDAEQLRKKGKKVEVKIFRLRLLFENNVHMSYAPIGQYKVTMCLQ